MSGEEIEMQIWEYMDGTCNDADRRRIAGLVATDATWKQLYEELSALHANISGGMQLEQPSMRFTKNVMETIATTQIAPATSGYINKSIIRGIAALFIVMLVSMLGYAIATNSSATTLSPYTLPKINLDWLNGLFTSTAFSIVVGINIILGLLLMDILFRRKKNQTSSL